MDIIIFTSYQDLFVGLGFADAGLLQIQMEDARNKLQTGKLFRL